MKKVTSIVIHVYVWSCLKIAHVIIFFFLQSLNLLLRVRHTQNFSIAIYIAKTI